MKYLSLLILGRGSGSSRTFDWFWVVVVMHEPILLFSLRNKVVVTTQGIISIESNISTVQNSFYFKPSFRRTVSILTNHLLSILFAHQIIAISNYKL